MFPQRALGSMLGGSQPRTRSIPWDAKQVARWAALQGANASVLQYITEQKLSGAAIANLRDDDIRSMFPRLGPRKEFQAIVTALREMCRRSAPSTPELSGNLSGWIRCPWKHARYFMRRGDPRFICSHDPVSCSVNPPAGASLVLVLPIRAVHLMYLYDAEEIGALEPADAGRVILPVACTASGDPRRYTLRKMGTMETLPDPAYVNMHPSAFCIRVLQLKAIGGTSGGKRSTIDSGQRVSTQQEAHAKRRRSTRASRARGCS